MMEKQFRFQTDDVKTMEQIIKEKSLHINHIILPAGESFPKHTANATVYMAVLRGTLTLALDDLDAQVYQRGDLLQIPQGTVMQGFNQQENTLELWIVKRFD